MFFNKNITISPKAQQFQKFHPFYRHIKFQNVHIATSQQTREKVWRTTQSALKGNNATRYFRIVIFFAQGASSIIIEEITDFGGWVSYLLLFLCFYRGKIVVCFFYSWDTFSAVISREIHVRKKIKTKLILWIDVHLAMCWYLNKNKLMFYVINLAKTKLITWKNLTKVVMNEVAVKNILMKL